MVAKRIGVGLIIIGAIGIALSLLISSLLHTQADSQFIRILGIEISAIIILIGLCPILADTTEEIQFGNQIRHLVYQILNLPVITWVLIGFLVVFFRAFIVPVFLNSDLQMKYLTGYVPNLAPIGNDLIVMTDQIKGWITTNKSPYNVQFYPPLTYIIFSPLLLIKDYLTLFRFFTVFTLLNYCLLTLLLPLRLIGKKGLPLALFFFLTGLLSYGLQFEVERGQYNIFAFLLCLFSIYIFHYHPKYRLIAYFLFSLSIQLKLYPAIFVVMFVDDWKNWKAVLLRFVGLGLFNFILFFAMGYQIFGDFIHSVTAQIVQPSWHGSWNHSISSFVDTIKADGLGLIDLNTLRVLRHNAGWIEAIFLLGFIILFISNLVIFYRRKETGLDPYLLLACTIGAMILPISYDYKLSILAAPMSLFLSGISNIEKTWHKFVSILLILGISLAYATTLLPFKYRPYFLSNIFPSLFLILILATILNFMRYKYGKIELTENEASA